MGTINLPIPWADFHRAGHPPAFSYGQPDVCPLCRADDLVEYGNSLPDGVSTEAFAEAANLRHAASKGE